MCNSSLLQKVQSHLRYEQSSGGLFWVAATSKNKQYLVGSRAGTIERNGYWHVRLFGTSYLQHRIIWLMSTGALPSGVIDHIDGDKLNNRLSNLRDVTPAVNAMNRHKARIDSSTGIMGVQKISEGCWNAYISRDGRKINLGNYGNIAEAEAARKAGKQVIHAEAANV